MSATATINLRISEAERDLIDHAAQSVGKSRTAFILEHSLSMAEEIMLDRTRFTLDAQQWEAMQEALDTPPSKAQLAGLQKLLTVKAPWDV